MEKKESTLRAKRLFVKLVDFGFANEMIASSNLSLCLLFVCFVVSVFLFFAIQWVVRWGQNRQAGRQVSGIQYINRNCMYIPSFFWKQKMRIYCYMQYTLVFCVRRKESLIYQKPWTVLHAYNYNTVISSCMCKANTPKQSTRIIIYMVPHGAVHG